MTASDARIAANRANALKSTGPKTDEGKERSRSNAVRHGLTGAGVALSPADAAAVEDRARAFQESYRPATEAGRDLVRRAAMLSVRLERCAVREAAAIATHVRAAEVDFDEARHDEVDALFAQLAEDPARALRRLMRMPEGVDRMIAAWRDLRFDLTHANTYRWKDAHRDLAVRLTGRKPGGMGCSRVEALLEAHAYRFGLLDPEDGAGLENKARSEWARAELASLMEAEARRLEAHRATMDLGAIEADRAGAAERALFDPSKEETLARRYEAAAQREMHRALAEMRAVEAEAAEHGESVPASPASPASVGSFSPTAPAGPLGPPATAQGPRPAPEGAPGFVRTGPIRAETGRS